MLMSPRSRVTCSGRMPNVSVLPSRPPRGSTGTVASPLPASETVHAVVADAGAGDVEEVHARIADEAGDEGVGGLVIELERRARLGDLAPIEHDDAIGHGHGLDLVVGDVDHRRVEVFVELGEFDAHVGAQRRVEIGQRLVEQEDARVAHDGAADGDALALAAGKLARACCSRSWSCRMSAARPTRSFTSACGSFSPAAERRCSRTRSYADRAHRTGRPWRCRA